MRRALVQGDDVTVVHLAVRERAVVESVAEEGRVVTVVTEEGALLRFQLARGSAHFVTADGAARLALS